MEITLKEALPTVKKLLRAGLVPNLISSPGIGKSSLAKQVAESAKLKFIDIRLAGYDPTLIDGYITLNSEEPKAFTKPLDVFPIESDPIPNGYNGWLILLDEFTSAPRAVQAAAYRLLLDKEVGSHKLHKNVCIITAGNKETDNAIASPLGTALQSRVCTLQIKGDTKAWVDWAINNNIDDRVISFIEYTGNRISDFNPNHDDVTFLCGRTAEFVSKYLTKNKITDINITAKPAIAGLIGEGNAVEFIAFCQTKLPNLDAIINDPKGSGIPNDAGTKFLLTAALASKTDNTNVGDIMQYIHRLSIEFQFSYISKTTKQKPFFINHPVREKWVMDKSEYLM